MNHLMDAIASIHDETRTSLNSTEENTIQPINNKDLFSTREKNYRGRLSKQ